MSDEENNTHDSDRSDDHDSHESSEHDSGERAERHDESDGGRTEHHDESDGGRTEHHDSERSEHHDESDGERTEHHDSERSEHHDDSDDHDSGDEVPTVSVSDLDDDARMIDVRERHEWEAGHAPGARLSPLKDLGTSLGNIDINENIPVICASGGRSSQAVEFLRKEGYDAVSVEGGMKAWAEADKPMVSETDEEPRVV